VTVEDVPHGPHKIAPNGQLVIPREVLKQAHVSPGDKVYVTVRSGVIELVPANRVAEWYRRGRGDASAE
jgi:AbrB family looped-hinge helix DNA binding protein